MILVESAESHAQMDAWTPEDIGAQALLVACATEAARQARAMNQLDAVLGDALQTMSGAPHPVTSSPSSLSALIGGLQSADRLRQEIEGLAGVLELLASLDTLAVVIRAEQVRARTPLAALQQRLLVPQSSTTG